MNHSHFVTAPTRRVGSHTWTATVGDCTAAGSSVTLAARLAGARYFEVPEEQIDLIVLNARVIRVGVKQPKDNFWPVFAVAVLLFLLGCGLVAMAWIAWEDFS